MLQLIRSIREMDFAQLIQVYSQSNLEYGKRHCRNGTYWEQLRCGEAYMRESVSSFLREQGTMVALWSPEGRAVTGLRLQPYHDGMLLSCLETAPEARGKGYAGALLCHTLSCLSDGSSLAVYSHIKKDNAVSLAVHQRAGFRICADHAVLLDGSVSRGYYTLCSQN